jgi:putative phosphoribosyl transferase
VFRNREHAGSQLADCLKRRHLRNALVLAIPRGGVVVGAVVACELKAELDVVLSRKLRAPTQPELAIGAISEGGEVHLNTYAEDALGINPDYLGKERHRQLIEIAHRRELFRRVRPKAEVAGRSTIVTDDGIATGSTMIAALQSIRPQSPFELIVAVPVASPDRLAEVCQWCDSVICLVAPDDILAIGQFYKDFDPVEDEEVVRLLRKFGVPQATAPAFPKAR